MSMNRLIARIEEASDRPEIRSRKAREERKPDGEYRVFVKIYHDNGFASGTMSGAGSSLAYEGTSLKKANEIADKYEKKGMETYILFGTKDQPMTPPYQKTIRGQF